MALRIAPYNDAMRLGMGFNSFTQQLCVHGAVEPKGEDSSFARCDFRPSDRPATVTGVDGSKVDIAQDVTWTAKFVDRISEVAEAMNVSASLLIKSDAMASARSPAASFLNTNTSSFHESDINYLIQVKVNIQRIAVPDVTEFCSIDGIAGSDFTRVYGDSFISGFVEGGEFTALVSIKLRDRSQMTEIRRRLKADLSPVSGQENIAMADSALSIEGETTISVLRRGGGDIKGGTAARWTLKSLKAAAKSFPDYVIACPVRTHAIISKYTSLKSFYARTIKEAPLEYDNAEVYPSVLLDAYMDYKFMRRDIQTAIRKVERGTSELIAPLTTPEFEEFSLAAEATHQAALHKRGLADEQATVPIGEASIDDDTFVFDGASISSSMSFVSDASSPITSAAAAQANVAPASGVLAALPNGLVPYKASIFGLEKARRDCQVEMNKIVREVDAVAKDPEVACDPERGSQHLSPAIFRMLIPSVRDLEKERAAFQAAEEAKKLYDEKVEAEQKLRSELMATQKELMTSKEKFEKVAEEAKMLREEKVIAERKSRSELTATQKELKTIQEKFNEVETRRKEIERWEACCPMPPGTRVRFRMWLTGKCLDFSWSGGKGDRSVIQWHTLQNGNQEWTLEQVGPIGFAIRHVKSGRYLTTGPQGKDGRFYMTTHDMPTTYLFEPKKDDLYSIHWAVKPQYTLNLEAGGHDNGTKVILWPHDKSDNDLWYIKAYSEI